MTTSSISFIIHHMSSFETSPHSAKQNDKCTFSIWHFHEHHMQNSAVWQKQCPNHCLCKVHGQTTLWPPAQLRTSCSNITAAPMRCSTANFTHPLQQLLAAEDFVRPLPPREFQFCELLGLVRESPRVQAMTSLFAVTPTILHPQLSPPELQMS